MGIGPNPGWGQSGWNYGLWGNPPIEYLPTGYYQGLLTSEYRGAPNLNNFLLLVLQMLNDASLCLASFITAFDLPQAKGAQLDIIGTIVGISRTVPFQPSNSVSPVLDDATYRILLQATIFQNQWDGKLASLNAFWPTLFSGGSLTIDDDMTMSATVIVTGAFSSIIQDLIVNGFLVPRPQGVLYQYSFATQPWFGVDYDNSFVAGVDGGHVV